jgi:hypothetical protein
VPERRRNLGAASRSYLSILINAVLIDECCEAATHRLRCGKNCAWRLLSLPTAASWIIRPSEVCPVGD